jgi:hypothetical protein
MILHGVNKLINISLVKLDKNGILRAINPARVKFINFLYFRDILTMLQEGNFL